ncbi:MAG TPA: hypothetical protein VGN78_08535 [Solirubrobacteraceae bacterium]|jgi:hypothetical protein|nr:hypothetical protein [Solirubrobacteraceae bacterium]
MTAWHRAVGWTGRADVASYGVRVREFVAQAWIAPPSPAAADELLTGGCALALALEAECRRLEREIADLAPDATLPEVAQRLRRLPPELERARRQLAEVRAAIAELRQHAGRPSR